jgi:hypothetical protein
MALGQVQARIGKTFRDDRFLEWSSLIFSGRKKMMINLYQRMKCPYSARVREWIVDHNLSKFIHFINLDYHPKTEKTFEELTKST